MIGAYANVYAGSLEGQVHTPNLHFYKKEAGNWISTGFFLWEVDFGSDGYSGPIALQGNYAYARSHWREGLDVYHFDRTEWHFKEKWLGSRFETVKNSRLSELLKLKMNTRNLMFSVFEKMQNKTNPLKRLTSIRFSIDPDPEALEWDEN